MFDKLVPLRLVVNLSRKLSFDSGMCWYQRSLVCGALFLCILKWLAALLLEFRLDGLRNDVWLGELRAVGVVFIFSGDAYHFCYVVHVEHLIGVLNFRHCKNSL